jgi:hypothetical protein
MCRFTLFKVPYTPYSLRNYRTKIVGKPLKRRSSDTEDFLKYQQSKNVIVFPVYGELSPTYLTCTKFHKLIHLHFSCRTDIVIVFRRFRSEKRIVASSCKLVLPYAHIRMPVNERIFVKLFVYFFTKICRKFQIFG